MIKLFIVDGDESELKDIISDSDYHYMKLLWKYYEKVSIQSIQLTMFRLAKLNYLNSLSFV